MNVHIVCIDDGHIVPRMSRWLVDAHGWSMSERPADGADANYYLPYTAVTYGLVDTLTVARFTHYETGNSGKTHLWRLAAERVDLRLYTADVYCDRLQAKGLTYKLTPGIDQDKFVIKDIEKARGSVGVAGIASPRKGAEMLEALPDEADLTVAGRGVWNETPATWQDDMTAWYNALDVYLCTSFVEGEPMPPLEALACGTKVVIPDGVGIMDELSEQPGIRHYEAGDKVDMRRALQMALEDEPPRKTLRDAVANYTIDAWCDSHARALAKLLEGA